MILNCFLYQLLHKANAYKTLLLYPYNFNCVISSIRFASHKLLRVGNTKKIFHCEKYYIVSMQLFTDYDLSWLEGPCIGNNVISKPYMTVFYKLAMFLKRLFAK